MWNGRRSRTRTPAAGRLRETASASTSMPASESGRMWSSPRTWIRCLPLSPAVKTICSCYGRGSCDAKGIIAAQVAAAEQLRDAGVKVGLLFVVGEERDSLGARVANESPKGSRFLINGEPTDNRLALASKGALRAEIRAQGKMAHSAYPELGESAINKLVHGSRTSAGARIAGDRRRGSKHAQYRIDSRGPRAKCHRRCRGSASPGQAGGSGRGDAQGDSGCRCRIGRGRVHAWNFLSCA